MTIAGNDVLTRRLSGTHHRGGAEWQAGVRGGGARGCGQAVRTLLAARSVPQQTGALTLKCSLLFPRYYCARAHRSTSSVVSE
jgi:hypothetical protein